MAIEIVDLPIENGDVPYIYVYTGWWFQPLWKIWKSVGMMTFPTDWKNKK